MYQLNVLKSGPSQATAGTDLPADFLAVDRMIRCVIERWSSVCVRYVLYRLSLDDVSSRRPTVEKVRISCRKQFLEVGCPLIAVLVTLVVFSDFLST